MHRALICTAAFLLALTTLARAQPTTQPTPQPTEAEPYREPRRPQFHFTARKNWLNDPNGLVYFAGEYHLFFQHNSHGIEWGDMTWGHAVSPDLVHWKQLANAIEPDALGTIYSGSAVVDWGNTSGLGTGTDAPPLVAMYTAAGGKSDESKGKLFTQCIAFSSDKGRTWTKFAGNPVIPHIAAENRDPKLVWHAPTKRWIVAMYEDSNRFSLHNSPDLKHWTKLQDIEVSGGAECPDFFPIPLDGDAAPAAQLWVLICADARYLVGTFDGTKFTPQQPVQRLDFGANFYAVQTYSDIPPADGRRIQIAWMRGPRYEGMPFNQQMSFPTQLNLKTTPDGPRLFRTPVAEIERLHEPAKSLTLTDLKLNPDDPAPAALAQLKGDLFHIRVEFKPGAASEVGLIVLGQTISYLVPKHELHALGDAPLELVDGRDRLELLVDRTSIETFGNDGRVAMCSCFDPKPVAGEAPVRPYAKGGAARVTSLSVFPLRSAWE